MSTQSPSSQVVEIPPAIDSDASFSLSSPGSQSKSSSSPGSTKIQTNQPEGCATVWENRTAAQGNHTSMKDKSTVQDRGSEKQYSGAATQDDTSMQYKSTMKDSGCSTQASRYATQDSGYAVQDNKMSMQDESAMKDGRSATQDRGSATQDNEISMQYWSIIEAIRCATQDRGCATQNGGSATQDRGSATQDEEPSMQDESTMKASGSTTQQSGSVTQDRGSATQDNETCMQDEPTIQRSGFATQSRGSNPPPPSPQSPARSQGLDSGSFCGRTSRKRKTTFLNEKSETLVNSSTQVGGFATQNENSMQEESTMQDSRSATQDNKISMQCESTIEAIGCATQDRGSSIHDRETPMEEGSIMKDRGCGTHASASATPENESSMQGESTMKNGGCATQHNKTPMQDVFAMKDSRSDAQNNEISMQDEPTMKSNESATQDNGFATQNEISTNDESAMQTSRSDAQDNKTSMHVESTMKNSGSAPQDRGSATQDNGGAMQDRESATQDKETSKQDEPNTQSSGSTTQSRVSDPPPCSPSPARSPGLDSGSFSGSTSRKRKAKFSNEERETLVNFVVKHFSPLFGLEAFRTEAIRRNQRRGELWREIQRSMSDLGYTPRTVDDLKQKWREIRLDVKRKVNTIRASTGSTRAAVFRSRLTPLEELVATTLGKSHLEWEHDCVYHESGLPIEPVFFPIRGPKTDSGRRERQTVLIAPKPEPVVQKIAMAPAILTTSQCPAILTTTARITFITVPEAAALEQTAVDLSQHTDIDKKPIPGSGLVVKEEGGPSLLPGTRSGEVGPCDSKGSTVVSSAGCLVQLATQPHCGNNVRSEKPPSIMASDQVDVLNIKMEKEDDGYGEGGGKEIGFGSLASELVPPQCRGGKKKWEPQSGSPEQSENVKEDSLHSSASCKLEKEVGDPREGEAENMDTGSLPSEPVSPKWPVGNESQQQLASPQHSESAREDSIHSSASCKMEDDEEDSREGETEDMDIGSLPSEPVPPKWQVAREELEQQPRSPQRRENTLPPSASQEGTQAPVTDVPPGDGCSCFLEDERAMWQTNMRRYLELEERWNQLYRQEMALWEEDRLQQQEQLVQDRLLQQQLVSVMIDIRDELNQFREQQVISRESQASADPSHGANPQHTSASDPSTPGPVGMTTANADSATYLLKSVTLRGRPTSTASAPCPSKPVRLRCHPRPSRQTTARTSNR